MAGIRKRGQCRVWEALNHFAGQHLRRQHGVPSAGQHMSRHCDSGGKRGQVFAAADIGPGFPGGARGAKIIRDNGVGSFRIQGQAGDLGECLPGSVGIAPGCPHGVPVILAHRFRGQRRRGDEQKARQSRRGAGSKELSRFAAHRVSDQNVLAGGEFGNQCRHVGGHVRDRAIRLRRRRLRVPPPPQIQRDAAEVGGEQIHHRLPGAGRAAEVVQENHCFFAVSRVRIG